MSNKRNGFTLIELLISVTIIAILVGMLLSAIRLVTESADKAHCASRLHQVGTAIQQYHDVYGAYPADTNTPSRLYILILPFVEQNANTESVEVFLCPSRRDKDAGTRTDFAAAWHASLSRWDLGARSVLGGLNSPGAELPTMPVTNDAVSACRGTSNTLLLTHKAMKPQHYISGAYGDNNDRGWINPRPYDYLRYANLLCQDHDGLPATCLSFGSPHAKSMPSLYADGSISNLRYDCELGLFDSLWTWNEARLEANQTPPPPPPGDDDTTLPPPPPPPGGHGQLPR